MSDTPRRRKSDLLMGINSVWITTVTGLGGTVVMGSEIIFKVIHAFGLHAGEHSACTELWGMEWAFMWSTALFLVSAAWSSGTPAQTGRDLLRGFVGRFTGGSERNSEEE